MREPTAVEQPGARGEGTGDWTACLADLRADQHRRWERGERVPAEEYLGRYRPARGGHQGSSPAGPHARRRTGTPPPGAGRGTTATTARARSTPYWPRPASRARWAGWALTGYWGCWAGAAWAWSSGRRRT